MELNTSHDEPFKMPPKEGQRVCLRCNKLFMSASPGNRICNPCSHKKPKTTKHGEVTGDASDNFYASNIKRKNPRNI